MSKSSMPAGNVAQSRGEEATQPWEQTDQQGDWIVLPTYFHVIHVADNDKSKVGGKRIQEQVNRLNEAFEKGRIRFEYKGIDNVDYTLNDEWFRMGLGTDTEVAAKKALGRDLDIALNIYTADLRGSGAHGYARQPWEFQHYRELDGVVVRYDSFPGDPEPFNRGGVAIHEVGHWFGLHHTFEGYGDPRGDLVKDTPLQAAPTGRHEDAATGPATINYMDLAVDNRRNHFTRGQFERIREVVLPAFKPWLLEQANTQV